jgi:hypothetical protein
MRRDVALHEGDAVRQILLEDASQLVHHGLGHEVRDDAGVGFDAHEISRRVCPTTYDSPLCVRHTSRKNQ